MKRFTKSLAVASASAIAATALVAPTAGATTYEVKYDSAKQYCTILQDGKVFDEGTMAYVRTQLDKDEYKYVIGAYDTLLSAASWFAEDAEVQEGSKEVRAVIRAYELCLDGKSGKVDSNFVDVNKGSDSGSSEDAGAADGSDFFKDANGEFTPGGIAVIVVSVLAGVAGIAGAAFAALGPTLGGLL